MKTETKAKAEFTVNIQLSEGEARAWDAIVGYGWESFQKVFYEHLGSSYLKPHEKHAKALFEDTRQTIGFQLHGIDKVKKAMQEINLKGQNEVETV